MAKQDYYDILGISRSAGADDIKKSYRKLAMKYHPDQNPEDKSAEHKFKNISEAYEVLSDEDKRAAYDRFGHAAFEGGGPGGPGAPPGGFDFSGGFADIFDEMFGDFMGGGGRRRGGAARGSDLRYNMEISLADAFKGKQTTIRVPTSVTCDACHGSGGEGGAQPMACPTCQGQGKIRAQQGFFTVERACVSCRGSGRTIDKPCKNCQGSGRVAKEKTLSVNIPMGVEDGTRIRLGGEGEAGMNGAPAGDLYLFLSVKPHRIFQREGADIHCRVPIPMVTSSLGGSIEVPTVDGARVRVTIPAGTQSGHQFRMKNKGMPVLNSKIHGDMFVQAIVETPVNLTKRQKELLKEFDKSNSPEKTSPESEGFFTHVKELWEDLKD